MSETTNVNKAVPGDPSTSITMDAAIGKDDSVFEETRKLAGKEDEKKKMYATVGQIRRLFNMPTFGVVGALR